MAQMFTLENTGLRYVREIKTHVDATHNNNPEAAHQWLGIAINQIPKDNLLKFRWETLHPMPSRLSKLLWQRQSKLEYIEVLPKYVHDSWNSEQERSEIDLLAEMNKLEFADLRKVRAVPDNAETALLACSALQRGAVTELEVDGLLWQEGDAREDEEDDEGGVHDLLTECLFDHVEYSMPGKVLEYDVLTSLTLKDINLTLCKRTWFGYLDFCHLKELRLEHCRGADIFLMQLASGAAKPGLYSFALVHDLGNTADRTIHAIQDLLSYPKHKVRRLELCLRNANELPDVKCICAHSQSLRSLLLDVAGKAHTPSSGPWSQPTQPPAKHSVLVYDTQAFLSLILSCSSLVELGIAFPDVGLEYKHFSQDCGEFTKWMDMVPKVLKLATLNVLNWPTNYKHGAHEGYYAAKNLQLARLAWDIFMLHRCFDVMTSSFVAFERHPALEVVAFGVREHGAGSPQPAYFVQSEVRILGKTVSHAQGVPLKYLRDHNLDIKILDYHERDFDETSRKNFGASARWDTVSNNGDQWG